MDYFDGVIAAKLFGKGGGGSTGDVSGKLDKVTTTALKPRVYAIKEDGGQTTYFATASTDANTIVMRDESKHIAVEDGVAPKQAVNKSQLDTKVTIPTSVTTGNLLQWDAENNILVDSGVSTNSIVSLEEDNTFSGVNTFSADVIFNNAIEANSNINVNNAFVKTTDTTKDIVTKYSANGISLEENGDSITHNYAFPRSSGTLGVTSHSVISNEDTTDHKIDTWKTTDSTATLAIYNQQDNRQTSVQVEDGYGSIAYTGTAGNMTRVAVSDGVIILSNSTSAGIQNTLTLTEDSVNINNKKIATVDDIAGIPVAVTITAPEGATNGTLDESQLATLQASKSNYIVFAHKKYTLKADGLVEGYLTYTYNGYENNKPVQEAITITVSTKAWVLNRSEIISSTDYANGDSAGIVTVNKDFSKGIEVSSTGNLSIYRALESDITSRVTTRPITPLNLNSAVLASLTDANKISPTEAQKTAFKTAWGITNTSGTQMVFAADEPSLEGHMQGDVYVNTTNSCFYCATTGEDGNLQWTLQDSFAQPQWHTTAPIDTSKVLRTTITWDKSIQYKSGSADTLNCHFLCSGDGYARFETNASNERLLQGCTNWPVTGSSEGTDEAGDAVIITGAMYYDTDSDIAKYLVHNINTSSSVYGMSFVPTTAAFKYLY